jgi:4-amino-4-deoxy-L-arabinose transferase-like glycosyltransferase
MIRMSRRSAVKIASGIPESFFRRHSYIIVLIALFLAARVYLFFTTAYVPAWDESVYYGMGKHLFSGGQAGLWETIRPPGLPIIAGAFWNAGMDSLLWTRVVITILAAASIALVYALGKRFHSRLAGAIGATLLATAPLFFAYSGKAMTELPSAFFLLLALWFLSSRREMLAGLSAGIAVLFRFPQGLFLIAAAALVIVALLYAFMQGLRTKANTRRRTPLRQNALLRQAAWFTVGVAIAIVPFLVANAVAYHDETISPFGAALRPLVLGMTHQHNPFEALPAGLHPLRDNLLFYPRELWQESPALLIGIIGALLSAAVYLAKRSHQQLRGQRQHGHHQQTSNAAHRKHQASDGSDSHVDPWRDARGRTTALAAIFLLLLLVYLFAIPNKQERFLLTLLPILALLASIWFAATTTRLWRSHRTVIDRAGALLLLALIVGSAWWGAERAYEEAQWPPNVPPWFIAQPDLIEQLEVAVDGGRRMGTHDGCVFTTDPVLAAYTDGPLLPFYEATSRGALDAVFINDRDGWDDLLRAPAAVYSTHAYPCKPVDGSDTWCAGRAAAVKERLDAWGEVADTYCDADNVWCWELYLPKK